jgi:hypothetical protein
MSELHPQAGHSPGFRWPDIWGKGDTVSCRFRRFALLVAAGLGLALLYHGLLHAFGLRYPWDTFLFDPSHQYSDWTESVRSVAESSPYVGALRSCYFPFPLLVMELAVGKSVVASMAIYALIAALAFLGGIFLFWRNWVRPAMGAKTAAADLGILLYLLLTVVACDPTWHGFDRGNIDLWVGGLCLIYIAEVYKPRAWLGTIALGLAIALKGYPLALVLLGLQQRKFLETGVAVVIAVAVSLVALQGFDGGIVLNWQRMHANQALFEDYYVLSVSSMVFSSDPYNGLRTVIWIGLHLYRDIFVPHAAQMAAHVGEHESATLLKSVTGGDSIHAQRILFMHSYMAAMTVLAAVSSLYVLFVQAPKWKRITVICLVMILYPHVASDYKLIVLLPAAFAILCDTSVDRSKRQAFWLIGLLLVPKSYLYIYGKSISMLINPVLLLALWWVAIGDLGKWREAWDGLRRTGLRYSAFIAWR